MIKPIDAIITMLLLIGFNVYFVAGNQIAMIYCGFLMIAVLIFLESSK